MKAAQVLERLGGLATAADLCQVLTRRQIAVAVDSGELVRLGRGRYALPVVSEGHRAAARVNGVVSHLSAALHWELPVKLVPAVPTVTVPRGRNLSPSRRAGVEVRYSDIPECSVIDGVTSPVRTVIDCARALPFDAALAVADSALRRGRVTRAELVMAAEASPRSGRARVLRVVRAADPRAMNPFESVLRAIAIERGIALQPQLRCFEFIKVDLGSNALRMAVEAESWRYHGDQRAFENDVRRYTTLSRERWVVLRFIWFDVMFRQEQVGDALVASAEWCAEMRQFAA